jgi:hypothetical protein
MKRFATPSDAGNPTGQGFSPWLRVRRTAIVTFWPSSAKIGHLVDVSSDGLAFNHSPGKEQMMESGSLTISVPYEGFYLKNLPFQTVSDEGDVTPSSSVIDLRRCEVAFVGLSAPQKSKLEHFIEHYT